LESKRTAFTLIELLIVVAIIAILAAIAVPNFLQAQVRAKVSRAKSDLKALATALESYLVDYNKYPEPLDVYRTGKYGFWIGYAHELTTPVAYMSTVDLKDPFNLPGRENNDPNYDGTFEYFNLETGWGAAMGTTANGGGSRRGYCMACWAPDNVRGNGMGGPHGPHIVMWPADGDKPRGTPYTDLIYDLTNGTISGGDIIYIGGQVPIQRVHGLVGG